jgi:hypothetical protein
LHLLFYYSIAVDYYGTQYYVVVHNCVIVGVHRGPVNNEPGVTNVPLKKFDIAGHYFFGAMSVGDFV